MVNTEKVVAGGRYSADFRPQTKSKSGPSLKFNLVVKADCVLRLEYTALSPCFGDRIAGRS
jgi:hypothetical protein